MTCMTEKLQRLWLYIQNNSIFQAMVGDPKPKGDSAGEEEQEDCPKVLSLKLV